MQRLKSSGHLRNHGYMVYYSADTNKRLEPYFIWL